MSDALTQASFYVILCAVGLAGIVGLALCAVLVIRWNQPEPKARRKRGKKK